MYKYKYIHLMYMRYGLYVKPNNVMSITTCSNVDSMHTAIFSLPFRVNANLTPKREG